MASWQPKKLDLTKINSGARFNNGDGVNADDINAVVESSAFVQSLGENQPQLIEDGGATSVSIDTTNNKFVFKNIKGQKGEQGIQGIQGERGEGVPSGGTVGQVLTKTASGTAWEDAKGGGVATQYITLIYNGTVTLDGGSWINCYLIPKGFNNYGFFQMNNGSIDLTSQQMDTSPNVNFSSNPMFGINIVGIDEVYYAPDPSIFEKFYVAVPWNFMGNTFENITGILLKME
jgi:hypothetical protein